MGSKAEQLAEQAFPVNALAQATDRSVVRRLEKASFKLPGTLKASVVQICARNGTDISTFLRECCENLRAAYGPEGA